MTSADALRNLRGVVKRQDLDMQMLRMLISATKEYLAALDREREPTERAPADSDNTPTPVSPIRGRR